MGGTYGGGPRSQRLAVLALAVAPSVPPPIERQVAMPTPQRSSIEAAIHSAWWSIWKASQEAGTSSLHEELRLDLTETLLWLSSVQTDLASSQRPHRRSVL